MTHTTIIEGNRRMWFWGNCLIDKKIDVLFSLLFFSRSLSIRMKGKIPFSMGMLRITFDLWWGPEDQTLTYPNHAGWSCMSIQSTFLPLKDFHMTLIHKYAHSSCVIVASAINQFCPYQFACTEHWAFVAFKWIRFCLHTSRPNVLKIIYVLSTNE